LRTWAAVAAPEAKLLIHETERLESTEPALQRYYDLVDKMQRHYGQILNVGAILETSFAGTGWQVMQSRSLVLEKPAREMAQLHLLNLRTWGRNEYAVRAFDRRELDELEAALEAISTGVSNAGIVCNTTRQIVAEYE
jgi:hypothetical protein